MTSYEKSKKLLVDYIKLKLEEEDWHGASDACCDLRDLEWYHRGLEAGRRGQSQEPSSTRPSYRVSVNPKHPSKIRLHIRK